MPFTADEVAKELVKVNKDYDATRSWNKLYGGVEAAYAAQAAGVTTDYNKAISEAYSAAEKERNAVMMSDLGQGYKAEAYDSINESLRKAFEQYQANYQSEISKVNSAEQKALSQVDTSLYNEAENTAKVLNSMPEYVKYLYKQYITNAEDMHYKDELKENIFRDKLGFGRFISDVDEEGNPIDIETAELDKLTLKDWSDIENEITDENSNLNIKGIDMYKLLFNELAVTGDSKYSYQSWLRSHDEELLKWLGTPNAYDVNAAGSSFGTVKKVLGLNAKDNQYAFVDMFGGLNEEELNKYFDKYVNNTEKLDELINKGKGTNPNEIKDTVYNLLDGLESMAIKMGIRESYGENVFATLKADIKKLSLNTKDNATIWWNSILDVLKTTAVGASTGGKYGGGMGAGIGAAIGGTIGTGVAIYDAQTTKASNKSVEEQVKDAYLNLATDLLLHAQTRRKEAQSKF